jgi:hypothetical protein
MLDSFFKLYWKDKFFSNEVNFTFIFKDLTFLLLPLFILYPITSHFGKISTFKFLGSTDFSFVVVVLLAMTLTGFIEFKTKVQRSINFKLFEGLKLYLLLLIASSITLTINLLNEFQVLKNSVDEVFFIVTNIILFFFGVVSLFMKTIYELGQKYSLNLIREFKTRNQILEIIEYENSQINKNLTHLLYTIENFKINENKAEIDEFKFNNYQRKAEEKIKNITRQIDDSEIILKEIKTKLENRKLELKNPHIQ